MVRLYDELRVLVAVLILSLALALGSGSAAVAALPGMSAEKHEIASIHHASSRHDADIQAPCHDRITDCCSSAAHCSGSGYAVFVAPVGAPGFAYSQGRAWATAIERCLKGLDPFVNRHPPRDRT